MKRISETATHILYVDYFEGQQVRVQQNKSTGELFFFSDDVAKVLGFKDQNEMMQSPKVKEVLRKAYEHTGKTSIIQIENNNYN
ncbi:MAG: hypothetical protein H7Y07_14890 [Pyrinomonadaceae bacterium]|nr:hypothetical protein [Sphingobacteriaceae bacterium]